MKAKHIDLIAIFVGVIFLLAVYIASITAQNQCQAHGNLSAEQLKNLPSSFYIENVPFYDYSMVNTTCMPASLGMVMRFYDNKSTPDELNARFPELPYSLDNFMKYAKSQGYTIDDYSSNMENLKLEISEGRPVIVSQWFDSYHKWGMNSHARVVVGYTDKYFITFDPAPEHGEYYNITFTDFAKLWNKEPEGGCNRAFLIYK
jgi:hypothetical protein